MLMDALQKQLESFKQLLRSCNQSPTSPLLKECRSFIEQFPRKLSEEENNEIRALLSKAFNIPDAAPKTVSGSFDSHIPRTGWLRDYYTYTLNSEPPAVFHFMSALTVLGASLERNVWFDKGFYKVYPNIATVLIAPTGRCRKTSATNISLKLARAVEVNVLSERVTPEALIQGLGGRDTATGLLYAPELAVFLGKQKYLVGMVPLLTTLFDCPDTWSSSTIMHGALNLTAVGLSFLGASTLEWFIEALPNEAFSGGFMARLLFVVQEDTDREFAFPEPGKGHKWEALREQLAEVRSNIKGEVTLEPEARDWYTKWYSKHHRTPTFDPKFAGYHERKPDHLIRIAFLLRIAEAMSLTVTSHDFKRALGILDWMETGLPSVFETVATTPVGAMQQRILQHLKLAGGRMSHTVLLRKNQHAMNARQFRESIETLKDSETIRELRSATEHVYEIIRRKK